MPQERDKMELVYYIIVTKPQGLGGLKTEGSYT